MASMSPQVEALERLLRDLQAVAAELDRRISVHDDALRWLERLEQDAPPRSHESNDASGGHSRAAKAVVARVPSAERSGPALASAEHALIDGLLQRARAARSVSAAGTAEARPRAVADIETPPARPPDRQRPAAPPDEQSPLTSPIRTPSDVLRLPRAYQTVKDEFVRALAGLRHTGPAQRRDSPSRARFLQTLRERFPGSRSSPGSAFGDADLAETLDGLRRVQPDVDPAACAAETPEQWAARVEAVSGALVHDAVADALPDVPTMSEREVLLLHRLVHSVRDAGALPAYLKRRPHA
jgi:hypothetical protein